MHSRRKDRLHSVVRDTLDRPLGSLRVSVTDRCNLRCTYCMPEDEYVWLPRESILTFEEIERLAGIFAGLGAGKVRITGGEPLLRQNLPALVGRLAPDPRITDLALTTNGILLGGLAPALKAAGLRRITLSLDTLQPERFLALTRSRRHRDVLDGLAAARTAGFSGTKINTVVVRGFNDDEIVDLLEFGRGNGVEVRFIEYMDVGGATRWSMARVVTRAEILRMVERRYGAVAPVRPADAAAARAPADRFALPDGTTFGVIASTTEPFCRTCDRSRLTADGTWLLCLYADAGLDLRGPLRGGATDEEIARQIAARWRRRTDRGAEERLTAPARTPLYQIEALRSDPHREMHTRGG
jgi:cyclic pyranopterin phosphate synthase